MGTEVYSSIGSLLSQLEKAKRGLQKIDEDIKKVVQTPGRFQNDRNNDRNFNNTNDGQRGPQRLNRGNFYQDNLNRSVDDRYGRKRLQQETKTVFSRLSARPSEDSDGEDEFSQSKKPRISSQVIRELPTKQDVLKAQAGDEVSKARNRRMFGSLLGTLQKFKQEEISLKNKEEKKAQVEKKIEEQAKQEKENQKRERQNLFAEREMKKATIKALEAKMLRMHTYEIWEKSQKILLNQIQTKWKPHIYWKPKRMNSQAQEKLDFSRKKQEKLLDEKQKKLKAELDMIEQRCLRNVKLPPGLRRKPPSMSQSNDQIDQDDTIGHDESMDAEDHPDDSFTSIPVIKSEDDYVRKSERTLEESRFKVKEEKNKDKDKDNGDAFPRSKESDDEDSSDDDSDKHEADIHDDSSNDKSTHDSEEVIEDMKQPKTEKDESANEVEEERTIENNEKLQSPPRQEENESPLEK